MAINILSTKILSHAQKAILTDARLNLEEYDAIKIEIFDQEIDRSYKNIIFTSQNTVKAFLKNVGNNVPIITQEPLIPISEIKAYCVGEKTRALLEQNKISVLESTHYGAELAKILVDKYRKESFLFLCGDKRLTEIPSQFQRHKIKFKEQVVYGNSPNPQAYTALFNGILFFSPTGIQSFVMKNQLKDRLSFCIGTTTAMEAQKYTQNVVVAYKPTVESVLEKVVAYFKTKIN
ncbi:MAG TPA: uroporphyrinogen-III synthase [Arenibacter sp.]|nr:uroporphyrinogen-III synthase [Arenibacter sp.]